MQGVGFRVWVDRGFVEGLYRVDIGFVEGL